MAAAACAAAAAVQRAQILMQAKTENDKTSTGGPLNGESPSKSPSNLKDLEDTSHSKTEEIGVSDGSGDGALVEGSKEAKDLPDEVQAAVEEVTAAAGDSGCKDFNASSDYSNTEPVGNAPSSVNMQTSVEGCEGSASAAAGTFSSEGHHVLEGSKGRITSLNSATSSPSSREPISTDEQSSALVESSSKESLVLHNHSHQQQLNLRNVCNAAPFLKEIIQGKTYYFLKIFEKLFKINLFVWMFWFVTSYWKFLLVYGSQLLIISLFIFLSIKKFKIK